MLTTGNQLRAARALAGLEQHDLAERSGVAVTTIRKMEWRGTETLSSGLDTIRRVQFALEAAGVEFLNHGKPGVKVDPERHMAAMALAEAKKLEQHPSGKPDPKTTAKGLRYFAEGIDPALEAPSGDAE